MIAILAFLAVALIYRIHVLASANPERTGIFVMIMLGIAWIFFHAAISGAVFRFQLHRWSQEENVIAVLFVLTDCMTTTCLFSNAIYFQLRDGAKIFRDWHGTRYEVTV